MKKIAAMALAAALVFSMASCTETSPGTNLPVVTQTPDSSIKDPSSVPDPDSSRGDPDSSKPDPSSKDDRLTPATTEIEDIIKSDYNDFTYFSKAQDYDNRTMIRKYYEGEIKDDLYKKGIFEKFRSMLKNDVITLKGEQSVSGGADVMLTLKTKSGEEYRLCKGILIEHPMEEGGPEVYILETPHSMYYLCSDYENSTTLESLVTAGVVTDENLVKTVLPQETPVKKGKSVQPDNPIAFITLRSNYAWGREFHGSCVDTAGKMYTFDYSKVSEGTYSGTFEERLQQLRKEERKMDNIKNNFTKKVINKVFGRESEIEKDNNILKETVSIQNEEIKGLKLSLQLTKEALKAEEEDHNELKSKYHEQILETERKENTLKDELSKSNKWLNSLFLVLNDIFKNMPEQKPILSTILRSFIHKDDFQEILKIHKQQVKPEKKQAESQQHKGSGIKR